METMEMRRLYVGNLSDGVGVEALKECFGHCGAVHDVFLAMDRGTGKSLQYAFVTMSSAAEADAAIERMGGVRLSGTRLQVRLASERGEAPRRRRERGKSRETPETLETKAAAPTTSLKTQFREAGNMTYELACGSARTLCLRVFPVDRREDAWRIEASLAGKVGVLSSGACGTRAQALEAIGLEWTRSQSFLVDWNAVTHALAAVRAI